MPSPCEGKDGIKIKYFVVGIERKPSTVAFQRTDQTTTPHLLIHLAVCSVLRCHFDISVLFREAGGRIIWGEQLYSPNLDGSCFCLGNKNYLEPPGDLCTSRLKISRLVYLWVVLLPLGRNRQLRNV